MQQYNEFVDKFKPRYTSDDTHTPLTLRTSQLNGNASTKRLARSNSPPARKS